MLARLLEINKIDYIIYDQGDPVKIPEHCQGAFDLHLELGQRVLHEAGLWEEVQKIGKFETQMIGAFDHRGEVITRNDQDTPQIDWCDFRPMMIKSIPEERIRWHCRVESVEKDEEGKIVVTFEDGSVEKDFKLVVGADGLWSKTRHLVSLYLPPAYL